MTKIVIKNRKKERRLGVKIVVASTISLFIDDVPERCDMCGRRVFLRPKTYFLAQREGSTILCPDCARKIGLNPEKLPTYTELNKADLQKARINNIIKQ